MSRLATLLKDRFFNALLVLILGLNVSPAHAEDVVPADMKILCHTFNDIDILLPNTNACRVTGRKQLTGLTREEILTGCKLAPIKNFIVVWLDKNPDQRPLDSIKTLDEFKDFILGLGFKRTLVLSIDRVPTKPLFDSAADKIDAHSTEAAFLNCEWILLAEYQGYEKKKDISFTNPPQAQFAFSKIIKGPPTGRYPEFWYQFSENRTDGAPPGWKFTPDKMPAKGTKFLLYVPNAVPIPNHGCDTYLGSWGRKEANEENIKALETVIDIYAVPDRKK